MKYTYKTLWSLLLVILVVGVGNSNAQNDTLVVDWLSGEGAVLENSLYDTIVADTNDSGERLNLNRVYKLQSSAFYYVKESIVNEGWHLNIVGEKPDPNNSDAFLPVIQAIHREDNTVVGKVISAQSDLTVKNAILTNVTSAGNYPYELYEIQAADARITFDNVVFEKSQWGFFGVYGAGSDLFVTNSTFRNMASHTQPWGGRGFSVWADVDTVWVENNTFLNINGFPMQIEGGAPNTLWVNQNTFVNSGRQVLLASWVIDGAFTNNLILNGYWQGEAGSEISQDRLESDDEQYSGMFTIQSLPGRYGRDLARKVAIANNSFFLESEYETYYTTDNDTFNIRKQPLLNVLTTELFNANPNMVVTENMFDEEEPDFATYPDNHQSRIQFITNVRNGVEPTEYGYWYPDQPTVEPLEATFSYPLPEDLSYTNSTLKSAAIGGYPLGDLNWFPAEKADWEANKADQYASIEGLFEGEITTEFLGALQAESATLTGDVAAEAAPARNLARIEASGNIVWDSFDVSAAGTYDVIVSHRTWYNDTSVGRATDMIVNGGDAINFTIGEEQDGTSWTEVTVSDVAFESGSNSLTLQKNWGYMEYQWVKIVEAGTENEVTTLWPGEAELVDGGSYIAPEGGLVASGDYMATFSGSGTIEFTYNGSAVPSLIVDVKYLSDGSDNIDVAVNGTSTAVALNGSLDSWTKASVDNVNLQEGDNTITITYSGSGTVKIDEVQLFGVEGLGTSSEDILTPDGFRLAQNYPNPFNPTTTINFNLGEMSRVNLGIYNILGQRVATLISGDQLASGRHTMQFDAAGLASGVYFYRLQAGDFVSTRQMTLIK